MVKAKKKCCLLIAVFIFCLACLTGCKKETADNSLIGTWAAVKAEYQGQEIALDVATKEQYFTLYEDGTYKAYFGENSGEGTWVKDKDGSTLRFDDDYDFVLKMDHQYLTCEHSDMIIYYEHE